MKTTTLNHFEKEIIRRGQELAKLNPHAKQLKQARQWWKAGRRCQYTNQDFDVLNGLVSALYDAGKKG